MPSVYTIEGTRSRKPKKRRRKRTLSVTLDAVGCRRVKHGKKRGCTIAICEDARGRMRFKKGSVRCGG